MKFYLIAPLIFFIQAQDKKEDPLSDNDPDVKVEEKFAAKDQKKRYFIIQPRKVSEGKLLKPLFLLPGGSGQAENFLSFIKNICKNLNGDYVILALHSPQWDDWQKENHIWPTRWALNNVEKLKQNKEIKFSTEDFIKSVYEEVKKMRIFDTGNAVIFGWSSSGPAIYAMASVKDKISFRGYYIRSSVFKEEQYDLTNFKGKKIYLQQGNKDETTPHTWAEKAALILKKNKANIELDIFDGGHSLNVKDIFPSIRKAIKWIETDIK
ncbi:MAG: hypothetical protein HY606_07730 [Planctomycetes bacterium]|nr:hypothetical protein [Planctomycetota bacterium]